MPGLNVMSLSVLIDVRLRHFDTGGGQNRVHQGCGRRLEPEEWPERLDGNRNAISGDAR